MIDEKKVLAAFTYAAYDAHQCGNELPIRVRRKNMADLARFVETGVDFPQEVIDAHERLASEVRTKGIRPYVYEHHPKVIAEQEPGAIDSFEDTVRTNVGYRAALLCSANFYTVNSVAADKINASMVISGEKRDLKLLPGLEMPRTGDVVSGHWGHYMEVLNPQSADYKRYLEISKKYHQQLRRIHEDQK